MSFDELLQDAVDRVTGFLPTAEARAYVDRPELASEARQVADLMDALARYELYPPEDGRAIGRYSPAVIVAPAARVLRKKLTDDHAYAAAWDAIVGTLTLGYTVCASVLLSSDPPIGLAASARSPEEIWALAVTNMNSGGIAGMGLGPTVAQMLQKLARDEFHLRVEVAGLKPRMKRARLDFLGYLYGDAGALMRYAQTSAVTNEQVYEAQATLLWPVDAAPTGGRK